MTSSQATPTTPEKQRTPITPEQSQIDLDSPLFDTIDCTPNTKKEMMSRKRKASQLIEKGSPTVTSAFLKWRLSVVERTLDVRVMQEQALSEANSFFQESGRPKPELVARLKQEEKALMTEKAYLLSQRKCLEGDLNDIDTSKTGLADAYINELRMSLEEASSSKEKVRALKAPRLDRRRFAKTVDDYLGTIQVSTYTNEVLAKWCHVLGYWLSPSSITCAHIVPFSFDTKDMAHMFGSDEPPLTSRRNGLNLQKAIEKAFDNCWITIVPLDSVESSPTEWKVVLLKTGIGDNVFFEDKLQNTSQRLWRWRDIDGRKLSFPNDYRPARRFLYMRYTLAWLHAESNGWVGFKEKVPSGQVWASPNKPDGYLRKSILLELGKKTGDKLPRDLMDAGMFEDPETSSLVYDVVAGIRVTEHVQAHLDGERDSKEDEDEVGEGMEQVMEEREMCED